MIDAKQLNRGLTLSHDAYDRALESIIERAQIALKRSRDNNYVGRVDTHLAHNLSAEIVALATAAAKHEMLQAVLVTLTAK